MHSKKPSEKHNDLQKYLPPAALVAAVVLFGLTQNAFFAIAAIATLAYILYVEFKATQNWKELANSLAVALGAWVALSLILNTTSPINIITSCSMLPSFERGDLIFLQEARLDAPTIQIQNNLQNLQYQPAEINTQGRTIARVFQPTKDGEVVFQPKFATCLRKPLDTTLQPQEQICLESITLQNQTISIRQSQDTVVFDSNTKAGLIIHRAYAILNATDGAYLLTKGDNNNFLDQQSGFALIPYKTAGRVLVNLPLIGTLALQENGLQLLQENQIPVKGKVLLRVPYIGYIKLLLFFQIQAPAGCESVLQKPA